MVSMQQMLAKTKLHFGYRYMTITQIQNKIEVISWKFVCTCNKILKSNVLDSKTIYSTISLQILLDKVYVNDSLGYNTVY